MKARTPEMAAKISKQLFMGIDDAIQHHAFGASALSQRERIIIAQIVCAILEPDGILDELMRE